MARAFAVHHQERLAASPFAARSRSSRRLTAAAAWYCASQTRCASVSLRTEPEGQRAAAHLMGRGVRSARLLGGVGREIALETLLRLIALGLWIGGALGLLTAVSGNGEGGIPIALIPGALGAFVWRGANKEARKG